MPGSAPKSADAVAHAFLAACNAKDFDACADLLAEEIRLVHHGRAVDVSGRGTEYG